ncbi:DUF1129 family protein [Peribacillus sp. SCS-26]|uniref:DUF1129 family protein n=1 Tax=Paraperibacillus marinus TaxID=3115295 RepID=UPI00390676E0
MNAKELIRLNNTKRRLLTKENEEYYGNMLVYIRTSLSISEQASEELLMELLDHLLEAQKEGKSAEEVFGNDPSSYCDEMIEQLPKEPGKNIAFFIGFLLLKLLGLMAAVSGTTDILMYYFKDSSIGTVYVGTALVTFMICAVIIFLYVFFIIKWLQKSIYKASSKVKDFIMLSLLTILSVVGMVFLPRFINPFGYAIEAGGFVYLIVGIAIILFTKWSDKKYHFTE